MHPRTTEVLDFLAEQYEVLRSAVDTVPVALRDQRPAPDRWSVGEVLDHLARVETGITKRLEESIDAARAAGLGPERDATPVLPTVNVARILDRARPVTASVSMLPPPDAVAASAWTSLAEGHDAVVAMLVAADGLALSDVVVPHPVLGALNVYQWAVFIAAHEARHASQIAEAGPVLGGSDR